MLCDLGLIWPSRSEAQLQFCFSLGGDPWPFACASLLQVQALTARLLSHWHAAQAHFFTYSVSTRGETQYENTASFHTYNPPPPFPSCKFYCLGVKHANLPVGGGSDMLELALSPFSFSPFKRFSCQETERLSLKLWGGEKKNDLTGFNNHRVVNQRDVMYNYYRV